MNRSVKWLPGVLPESAALFLILPDGEVPPEQLYCIHHRNMPEFLVDGTYSGLPFLIPSRARHCSVDSTAPVVV